ncbi:MAG TPA: hypothetical protein VGS98_10985 [Thermoanaerobaculia bacterium]|jgi:fructose-specific phosphotransferase system IIC component|nr:hypothetical protein [Thermoanaerobaculia bacterium]
MVDKNEDPEAALSVRIVRLEAVVQGVAWGLVAGLGLFLATNWLVLKGGRVVGPHLSLLRQFFIGYEVSFKGSLIGFAYAFVCGFLAGYLVSWVYNHVVRRRSDA